MTTGGGNNLGSTPTDEPPRWPLSRRSSGTSKRPTRLAFAEHEPTSKAWRGVGALDLYDSFTGQRAGPTVRKKTESNRVLTLRASSAVPVRGEIPLSVARFSCALSVRIWVSQGRTGEGNKLGASHPVFWIPPWQVFACLELTNWFPKRRNHDRSNGAKNTAMA